MSQKSPRRAPLIAAALAALLAEVGCSGVDRVYDGPRRDAAQVARVVPRDGTIIVAVDDKLLTDWNAPENQSVRADVEVLPGRHRVAVAMRWSQREGNVIRYAYSVNNYTMLLDAKAGQTYEVRAYRSDDKQWGVQLVDANSGATVANPED